MVDSSAMVEVFVTFSLLALLVHLTVSLFTSEFARMLFRLHGGPLERSRPDNIQVAPVVNLRDVETPVTEFRYSGLDASKGTPLNVNGGSGDSAQPSEDGEQPRSEVIVKKISPTVLALFLYHSERYLRIEIPSENIRLRSKRHVKAVSTSTLRVSKVMFIDKPPGKSP